jgi:hypothetical protein
MSFCWPTYNVNLKGQDKTCNMTTYKYNTFICTSIVLSPQKVSTRLNQTFSKLIKLIFESTALFGRNTGKKLKNTKKIAFKHLLLQYIKFQNMSMVNGYQRYERGISYPKLFTKLKSMWSTLLPVLISTNSARLIRLSNRKCSLILRHYKNM